MTTSSISQLRIQNQQIGGKEFNSVKDLVSWMGAIQAQDYGMAKYAIGVRLNKATEHAIEEAINKGEIIRTHLLRPTWHFAAAEDVRWMLELTSKNLNRILSSNNKKLGLDEKTFKKTNAIIKRILSEGKHLTRKEIMSALEKKGIQTNELRSLHIMFRAETDLIVCNGIKRDKQFTYALFEERIPPTKKLSKEEALAELARRYFWSHGPATIQDFNWWSGLSMTDAKMALELIKKDLNSQAMKENIFWFSNQEEIPKKRSSRLFFLPSFDEFLISYKSREISLAKHYASKAFTTNGIFNPIIVHNARVIGTWKPNYKKEISIIPHFFSRPTDKQQQLCLRSMKQFQRFMNK